MCYTGKCFWEQYMGDCGKPEDVPDFACGMPNDKEGWKLELINFGYKHFRKLIRFFWNYLWSCPTRDYETNIKLFEHYTCWWKPDYGKREPNQSKTEVFIS